MTPSYRSMRVAELARAGNPLLVRLRESNVLTSTIYRPSPDDSTFLFFSDDALRLRPELGVLWSVPELFFVNVRKGSFDHVARHAPTLRESSQALVAGRS